ncbi:hypothetical protein IAC76_02640, partial [Spirochaetes bacterium]|nr:hypothetical protein [Candidatus Scatousia excrementipullorum]
MINSTNFLLQKVNNIPTAKPPVTPPADNLLPVQQNDGNNILSLYLQNLSNINKPAVNSNTVNTQAAAQTEKVSDTAPVKHIVYRNNLRSMVQNNEAIILAILPRSFNAKDTNNNEYIDGNEQCGTFLNAIERLDEVKKDGFNALHLLPIHPPGKVKAMGTAGSVYSPLDLLEIDPMLVDKNDPRSPKEQCKAF